MTELEYVLEKFHTVFQPFKGKKILLHGTRNYAEAIIQQYDSEFQFIGVSGMEPIESGIFQGKKFYFTEELAALAPDLIILTERVKYEEEAFRKLKTLCMERGILLYNMYGVDEIQSHIDFEERGYLSYRQWKKILGNYDIVVFELLNGFFDLPDPEQPDRYVPRTQMRRIFRNLQEEHKKVFFSLRKSYPKEKQIRLLKEAQLFSSDDELKNALIIREGEDLSLRRIAEKYPKKKICYLGWGLVNEFLLPRYYGIDSFRISDESYDLQKMTRELMNHYSANSVNGTVSVQTIQEQIRNAEIISFDLFDTLLSRKVLYPKDIFYLWEKQAIRRVPALKLGLADARINAEKEHPQSSIWKIYQDIGEQLGLDKQLLDDLMQLEIETEKQYLAPRKKILSLLQYAKEEGKTVVICSDMYFPEEQMQELLRSLGISQYDRLFISCDYQTEKRTGLFEEIMRYYGEERQILHIGNDLDADIRSAHCYGLETCFIPSALLLAKQNGLEEVLSSELSLDERCFLGMIIDELYSDPFAGQSAKILQYKTFALGACAPVILGYLSWLVHILKTNTYDGVLFSSRDGYLLIKIYQMMQEKTASHLILPEAVYFYTNRHASFLSCMDDSDLWDLCLDLGRHMSAEMILRHFFDLQENAFEQISKDGISKRDILIECLPQIKEKAFKERHNYLQYTKRCGLRTEGNYVFSDFFAAGTTQHFLTQFIPFHLDGYYFGRPLYGKSNPLQINYYFYEKHQEIRERFMEMEYIMTSPEPALKAFSEDGNPLFSPEVRDEETMKEIKEIHEMILQFSKEYIRLFFTDETVIGADFAELLFCCGDYYGMMKAAYDDWGMFWIAEGEESNDD